MTTFSLNPSPEGAPALYCGLPAGQLCLAFLTPGLLRVRLAQAAFAARRSWAVTPPDSHFPGAELAVNTEGDQVLVSAAGGLSAAVNTHAGTLRIRDAHGVTLCAELEPARPGPQGVRWENQTQPGEHFYGFGQRAGIQLERSGRLLHNWTSDPARIHALNVDPLYMAVPLFLSVRPDGPAYGLYFNNTYRSAFDLRVPGRLVYTAEGGELDYYLLYGPSPPEVLEKVGLLLGRAPLPPRWALGYQQSRWSYSPAAEVRRIAAEFRQRGLPCDVIHLDIDYMDGYRVFTWAEERFPRPQQLAADLRAQGFRLVAIIDPGVKVDPAYPVYQQGLQRDFFIRAADGQVLQRFVWPDEAVFPDFSCPEVREWWGDWQQRGLIAQGIAGVWNDMNEPVVFDLPFSQGGGGVGTLPLDCPQGPAGERSTHAELHNLYGSHMARASYEGVRAHNPRERGFHLCRSGFAGIQRWTASWMGDNASCWEHLEMSLPQLMNMGLSGVPFVGVDIGGFNDNATPELFARWMQAGILYPFCRGHSAAGTSPHEPWAFGERVERIARAYLRLRYRLLPYLYTLFYLAHTRGEPILRPLLYHYQHDPAVYHLHDQAMLGPFLLAAPVLQPGRSARSVYLPQGEWYDYWSGQRLQGPSTILADAPLERLPLYVRAGAVLPMAPEMAYSDEKALDPLTLEIYAGAGEFTLYEDDGHSYAFESGQFALTPIQVARQGSRVLLEIGARQGDYDPGPRRVVVRLHVGGGLPAQERAFEDHGAARRLEFDI